MALITQELLASGFSEQEVAQIMGGNVIRILERVLPD
jgi:microsomal dipeptidase-like Zn-dependent dipeptidase